jgi:hypothetical protein
LFRALAGIAIVNWPAFGSVPIAIMPFAVEASSATASGIFRLTIGSLELESQRLAAEVVRNILVEHRIVIYDDERLRPIAI